MRSPNKTAKNGRSPNGQFAKGNPGGPGRPRGLDFRRVVTEQAYENGVELEAAIWRVCKALLKRAEKGDVQAARLLIDRLCESDPVESAQGYPQMTDEERVERINELFARVRRRRELEAAQAAAGGAG